MSAAPRRQPGRRAPRVGVVGGGQLARMTYDASVELGVDLLVLAQPGDEAVRGRVPDVTVVSELHLAALAEFSSRCDVLTFDHEKVSPQRIARLEGAGHVVRPGAGALTFAVDKAAQRRHLRDLGVPVPPFVVAEDLAAVRRFAIAHGWPVVVKAARGGYDGRGVVVVDGPGALEESGRPLLRAPGAQVVVEPHLAIQRELAVLVARRADGAKAVYPVVETHQDGAAICREVWAPAPIAADLATAARDLAVGVADAIGAVGMLAVELFVVDGELVVNELATRPHNTGHLTIDAAATSQFSNHLRAVLDLPLGPTALMAPAAAMANVIAEGTVDLGPLDARRVSALVGGPVAIHLYGKRSRPGRKVGHVTVMADDLVTARERAREAARYLECRSGGVAPSRVTVAS